MRPASRLHRGAALLGLALLAACARPAADRPTPRVEAAGAAVCRVGPDGGPPAQPARQAERGLGGTGMLAEGDRGIGGTGAPSRPVLQAERGLGGTGIVAVITGFASICLGGREVALDEAVPVLLDGAPASPAVLRAGQLAIVDAAGAGTALRAVQVRVRHEVSGPVEAVEAGGLLRVAGQRVAVTAATLGEAAPSPGQWVAVSGLRGPDGTVLATRIDRRPPGPVTLHGRLLREGGLLRIGTLEVRPAVPVPPGGYVTASGRYADGVLYAEEIRPDLLLIDPAGYFGPGIGLLLFEAYVTDIGGGGLRLGPGVTVQVPPGLRPAAPGRAVVALERQGGGGLRATGLRAPAAPDGGRAGPGPGGPMGLGGAGPGRSPQGPSGWTAAPVPGRMPGAEGMGLGRRDGLGGGRPGEGGAPGADRDSPGPGPGNAGPFGPGGRPGGRGR